MSRVLITGGSGGVGKRLTELAIADGHEVGWLSRRKRKVSGISTFVWEIEKQTIDSEAIDFAEVLIHLAGEGVADKPWTSKRKNEILESRAASTELLAKAFGEREGKLDSYFGASAVGYYGSGVSGEVKNELSSNGTDFLAQVCFEWEEGHKQVSKLAKATFIPRIGIVLDSKSGALPKLSKPARFYLAADLASGKQWMQWIHIDDLCRFFLWGISNPGKAGTYNLVSPGIVNHSDFNKILAQVLNRRVLLPNIPEFLLKLALGDMAQILIGGENVSSNELEQAGFSFRFTELQGALQDLL